MDMSYILETDNLTKQYGRKKALDNVSIHVGEGEIYGLVGRNGAGKTTLMRIIGGLAHATSGSFSFCGRSGNDLGDLVRQRGLLIEEPGIYPDYSGWKNIHIKCLAYGITDKDEPDRLLEMVGLKDAGKKRVGRYSFGMKQRLGLALAFAGSPKLMILDEPINGFDPQGIQNIREMIIEKHKQGTTFIISSHILGELSKMATKYGFINEGKLLEEDMSDALLEKCRSRIDLIADNTQRAVNLLDQLGFKQFRILDNGRIEIYEQLDRTGDITGALAAAGIATLEITRQYETLEDYYINLVDRKAGE